MKKYGMIFFWGLSLTACDVMRMEPQEPGGIRFRVDRAAWAEYAGEKGVKGADCVLDTNQFVLKVYAVSGEKVYDGKYGRRPAELTVPPGAYEVSLLSEEFVRPGFDCPQFGDRQTVIAKAGESSCVELRCSQLNAGIRLNCTAGFRKQFPGAGLKIADTSGTLLYRYGETGTAYVHPGKVELRYESGRGDTVLLSRQAEAAQMIRFNLSYASGWESSFRTVLDTARVWLEEEVNAGYGLPEGAVPAGEASSCTGRSGVTLFGYIMGGDATATTLRVGPPFKSRTHLVIASSPKERNRNRCVTVELPSGKIRDALNLVDHSRLLGRRIILTGDVVENYLNFTGLKKVKSYELP